jgi:hypothetical protein
MDDAKMTLPTFAGVSDMGDMTVLRVRHPRESESADPWTTIEEL